MRRWLACSLVRLAALRTPEPRRLRMRSEWLAEIEAGVERGEGWGLVRAAFGAFADARAIRHLERRGQREAGMGGWTRGWAKDAAIAVRSLRRAPGFTAVAVLTLGVGIGGTAAMYAVLDRVVLDPLPYPDAERLVRLDNQVPGVGPDAVWALSTAQWVFFTDNAATLDEIGLYRHTGGNLVTPSGPERVHGASVTASMMRLLGARAEMGRLITQADDEPSAAHVALVSHGFWTRVLGRDPDIIGRTLTLDGDPVEVIGVLAAGVELPGWPASLRPDLWLPMRVNRGGTFANSHVFPAIARMSDEVGPGEVEAELARLTTRLPEEFPRAYSKEFFDRYGFRTRAIPLRSDVLGTMATNLWLLFGGLAIVLLVAGSNVLNLFLVRMETRRREMELRIALGASRGAIARYVLSESMALALFGGVLGVVLGIWAVPMLTGLAPEDLPRIQGAHFGWTGVVFALGLSLLSGLAMAAYPIYSRSRGGAVSQMPDGRRATGAPTRRRARAAMVVTQVAAALVLVSGATLLVGSVSRLRQTDLGFRPEGVVTASVSMSRDRYPDDVSLWNFDRAFLERLKALPGIAAAGMGEEVPVIGGFGCTVQAFGDRTVYDRVEEAGLTTCAGQERVAPGYFEALGIPLLEGRYLEDGDSDDSSRSAVVVSRAFADRFWPGENALGRRVNPSGSSEEPFYTVVGVVGDVPKAADEGAAPLRDPAIAIYYPIVSDPAREWGRRWWWAGSMSLVVRGERGDPAQLVPEIRAVLGELDPEVPLSDVRTMEQVVDGALTEIIFVSLLLVIAAAVAVLLATVGLYGVISYWVASRSREIGTRIAIGARPREVRDAVVRDALLLTVGGLVVGAVLATGASRLLLGLVVGAEAPGLLAQAAGAALLLAVAVIASWVPARRAAAVDPAVALRAE
jgi:putative ABC transport system permease protein